MLLRFSEAVSVVFCVYIVTSKQSQSGEKQWRSMDLKLWQLETLV